MKDFVVELMFDIEKEKLRQDIKTITFNDILKDLTDYFNKHIHPTSQSNTTIPVPK